MKPVLKVGGGGEREREREREYYITAHKQTQIN